MGKNHDKKTESIDQTCNGKCSSRGTCCARYLYVSENEKNDIIEYCKENPDVPGLFLLYDLLTDDESISTKCPFWDREEEECMIYEIRPQVCRNNPDSSIETIDLIENNTKTDMLAFMHEIIDKYYFIDDEEE